MGLLRDLPNGLVLEFRGVTLVAHVFLLCSDYSPEVSIEPWEVHALYFCSARCYERWRNEARHTYGKDTPAE